MYAVIFSGGKQYRVKEGDTLKIESLPGTEEGSTVEFNEVLLVGQGADVKIGRPYVPGSKVMATVLRNGRHKKIRIIKFKRRKHHMKTQGHRQNFTEVTITQIQG